MPALLQYQRLYPQVTIDLELDNRRTDLTAEGFDLAVRIGEPTDSWGIARKLCTNHVCLAASPEFLKRHSLINSLSDLTALPAVSYAAEGLRFAQLEHLDDTGSLRASPMQIVFWCNNTEALLQATLAGIGWGCMSRFLAHEDLVSGRLVQLLPDVRMPPYKSVYVVYGQRELPLRVRLFLEVLESSVAQWAAWKG
ncbi:substrate binding domain-containing protein [Diaphorobacter sp. HDW4B]|uniref:substrate binding domain-containing protein n=1 Tax=Diaphorobacter sp. HDW4B TaxID=2714925 RepID=UPI001F108F14|nr:substrate binding domain-containing protein [Diaphorobacter sp. HDW4B]